MLTISCETDRLFERGAILNTLHPPTQHIPLTLVSMRPADICYVQTVNNAHDITWNSNAHSLSCKLCQKMLIIQPSGAFWCVHLLMQLLVKFAVQRSSLQQRGNAITFFHRYPRDVQLPQSKYLLVGLVVGFLSFSRSTTGVVASRYAENCWVQFDVW